MITVRLVKRHMPSRIIGENLSRTARMRAGKTRDLGEMFEAPVVRILDRNESSD
jgi:hypothetical protein